MKKTLNDLKNDRSEILQKMTALNEKAGNEGRNLDEAEQKEWNVYKKSLKELYSKIDREVEVLEATAKQAKFAPALDNQPSLQEENDKKKAVRNFSFIRAINAKAKGRELDGLELEMHQEAEKEARASGLELSGIGVPSFFVGKKRDLDIATEGTDLVQTDKGQLIGALTPKLMIEALGATMLTGLVGNLDLPRNNGIGTANWDTEKATATETTPTFDKISFSPNRLSTTTDITKQILLQSSVAMEQFVRGDLERAIRIAVDSAAINGNGGNINGILGTTGIGSVVGGTNGLAPTHDHLVDLETAIAVDNADLGNLAYLTTPGIRGKLKKTKVDAGSGVFVWPSGAKELNGYRAEISTQVPNDLDKGSSTGVCHAIIFGNFAEYIIGNWAGLDLIVNPYTKSKEAIVEVTIHSWWDMEARHAESFAAMKDALIS